MKFKQYYRQVDSEMREMLSCIDAQDAMLRRQAETVKAQDKIIAHLTRALLKVDRIRTKRMDRISHIERGGVVVFDLREPISPEYFPIGVIAVDFGTQPPKVTVKED